MKVIHFLGYKDGGKTRAVSYVARGLTGKGRRVGTVKHIHASGFDIDTKGKDTWVHRQSGARVVVAVSPDEMVTMARRESPKVDMADVFRSFKKDIDYVRVEGFGNELRQKEVLRVVCARSKKDALRLVRAHGKPLCVVGELDDDPECEVLRGVPVLRLPEDSARLLRLIGEA